MNSTANNVVTYEMSAFIGGFIWVFEIASRRLEWRAGPALMSRFRELNLKFRPKE